MPHTYRMQLFAVAVKLNNLALHKLYLNLPPLGSQSEAGVREFHIVQVSSSSQHWRLHKCINPAKDKGVSAVLHFFHGLFQFVLLFFIVYSCM